MKQSLFFFTLLAITIASCRNPYTTASYETRKFEHSTVAVVPPVSMYTGKIPEEMTEDQIHLIEDEEAIRFQEILHSRLIMESGARRRDIRVDFISPAVVNQRLKEAGISVRDAATADPMMLGKALGVDVVVRGHLKMNRFMSDLNSMKIEAAEVALRTILNVTKAPVGMPAGTGNLNRTYLIECGAEVVDVKDGIAIWKNNTARNADWNYQPEQAIASMAVQFANRFPYRNREFK